MTKFFRKSLIYLIMTMLVLPASVMVSMSKAPKAEASSESAPTLVVYTLDNPVISPNGDTVKDTATIDLKFSEAVKVNVDIVKQSDDMKVKDLYDSSSVTDPTPKTWDGLGVSDNVYVVKIIYDDSYGHSVTDTSKTITVDTDEPNVSIVGPKMLDKVNGSAVITFTDTEKTNPQCSIDNSTWTNCISGVTQLSELTGFNALPEGNFNLYLKDTDLVGNVGTDHENNIEKDSIAPVAFFEKGTTANSGVVDVSKPLYYYDSLHNLVKIDNDTELKDEFVASSGVSITSANYSNEKITFGILGAVRGSTIQIKDGENAYDEAGNLYVPQVATFNGTNWVFGSDIDGPVASIDPGSNKFAAVVSLNEPLYSYDISGNLVPVADSTLLTDQFMTSGGFAVEAAYSQSKISLVINGTVKTGDTVSLKSTAEAYDVAGNSYVHQTATFNGIYWTFGGIGLIAPVATATKIDSNNGRFVRVSWHGLGNGVDKYQVYVNGILSLTKAVVGDDSAVNYSQDIKVLNDGSYNIYVRAWRGSESTQSTTCKVEFVTAVVAPAPVQAAPVSIAPSKAKAADNTVTTPKVPSDEAGKIKGDESASSDEEKTNWTPWIVLSVLIILAGAATGGYFYWFSGVEEVKAVVKEPKKISRVGDKKSDTKKITPSKKTKRW